MTHSPLEQHPLSDRSSGVSPEVAALYFPSWPIQRLFAEEPELRQRCVVLSRQDSRRRQIVYAASQSARREGILPGAFLAEVRSLLHKQAENWQPRNWQTWNRQAGNRTDSSVVTREADVVGDRERLTALGVELHTFSPWIGLGQTDVAGEPDSLLLNLRGITHLFGGEAAWCEALKKWLASHGWYARIAIAPTVGATLAIARYSQGGSRFQIVHSHEAALRLDPLPVKALRLPATTCDTLAELGVRTIGELRRLPRAGLASRFGEAPARRLDQLVDPHAELIDSVTPPDHFTASLSLEHPVADRLALAMIVEELVSKIASMLASKQRGALRWLIRFDRIQAKSIDLQVHLYSPTIEAEPLQQLLEMHLEQLRGFNTTKNPIHRVSVIALESVRVVPQQLELFDLQDNLQDQVGDRSALASLINRLTARLGTECVVRPQVLSENQPEHAVRYYPLAGSRAPVRQSRKVSLGAIPRPLERPLRLLQKPIPVVVDADSSGTPRTICLEGKLHLIAKEIGPERIETGWWRGRSACRDYWRIETTSAQRLWIYYELQRKRWMWHGVF